MNDKVMPDPIAAMVAIRGQLSAISWKSDPLLPAEPCARAKQILQGSSLLFVRSLAKWLSRWLALSLAYSSGWGDA